MFWKVFLHHRVTNYIMAWTEFIDGIIGIITFGFVHGTASYKYSSWSVGKSMEKGMKIIYE